MGNTPARCIRAFIGSDGTQLSRSLIHRFLHRYFNMSESTSSITDVAKHLDETANSAKTLHPQSQNLGIDDAAPDVNRRFLRRVALSIVGGIPTMIVLATFGGLAWWGHHHGWHLPKFSELTTTEVEKGELWCDEHGVAEADCIACNADLMPKPVLFGWCDEHGVHECVFEHPELAQLKDLPEITAADFDRAARAITSYPRTKNEPGCKMHLRRIQFPSIEAVDSTGIDIALVDRGPVVETIKTTGEVVYDPTRVARLSSRASGTVWRVEKNVGDQVQQGEVLALVDAADVGRLKSELMQALVQLDLNSKILQRLDNIGAGVIPGKRLDEAETASAESGVAVQNAIQALANLGLNVELDELRQQPVDEVRERLKFLGISESIQSTMNASQVSANLIPIVSPRAGIVVTRDAVAGEVIDTGKSLFMVADISQMWLQLNVRLEDAQRIALGQKVLFRPDGSAQTAAGKITWISTDVNSETRTIRVRAELPNREANLRNETFGAGEIVLREEYSILVPGDAIHWEGCCHVAFVRDKDYFEEGSYKVFHTRSVRPGATMGDKVEVIAGLLPDEVVVAKGSGILRAELLKGNLGAG